MCVVVHDVMSCHTVTLPGYDVEHTDTTVITKLCIEPQQLIRRVMSEYYRRKSSSH